MAIESYQNMMDPKEIFDQRVRMRSHMIPHKFYNKNAGTHTIQIYSIFGHFDGFAFNSALFSLVIYSDP